MVKGSYSVEPENPAKSCKARGDNLRVHFKHCREIAHTIRGWKATKAKSFLENVLAHKEAVPFRRYTGGTSRHAQGKVLKAPGNCVRWPEKASRLFLDLLRNATANAEIKSLDADLVVSHVQANRAPQMRRRTYRAHGRINAYMANPAHIELILTEANKVVPKASEPRAPRKLSSKEQAKKRLTSGGGVVA